MQPWPVSTRVLHLVLPGLKPQPLRTPGMAGVMPRHVIAMVVPETSICSLQPTNIVVTLVRARLPDGAVIVKPRRLAVATAQPTESMVRRAVVATVVTLAIAMVEVEEVEVATTNTASEVPLQIVAMGAPLDEEHRRLGAQSGSNMTTP